LKTVHWNIVPAGSPVYLKKCSHCKEKRPFYNSEKFRVNAQQKQLDVWLIYRCTQCDCSWNIDVHSRVSPKQLDPNRYHGFLENDRELAKQIACDLQVIRQNHVQVSYEGMDYLPLTQPLSWEEIQQLEDELVEICITCPLYFGLNLSQLLKREWGLSRRQLQELNDAHILYLESGESIVKAKLKHSLKLFVKIKKGVQKKQDEPTALHSLSNQQCLASELLPAGRANIRD
jgi:hypothetical protein